MYSFTKENLYMARNHAILIIDYERDYEYGMQSGVAILIHSYVVPLLLQFVVISKVAKSSRTISRSDLIIIPTSVLPTLISRGQAAFFVFFVVAEPSTTKKHGKIDLAT